MAEEVNGVAAEEGGPHSWRALWVSAGALLATLALIGLIYLVTQSNRDRDEALYVFLLGLLMRWRFRRGGWKALRVVEPASLELQERTT